MRVLLFGSRGYIGEAFQRLYPEAYTPRVDIADPRAVEDALETTKPDVIINAAGKTGRPNIDWCEEHKEETLRSNVTGPLVLLDACARRGMYLVHLSSGCIFQGDNGGEGFSEEDAPNFTGSFYSRTKIWSDRILAEFTERKEGRGGILILRLRMPFDGSENERNLLMKLRKYARVLDAPNSITYLPDFLNAASILMNRRATGITHVVNPDPVSPYWIMERYKVIVDPVHAFERLRQEDLPDVTKAGRSNCILTAGKLEGITMLSAKDAVEEALQRMTSRNGVQTANVL